MLLSLEVRAIFGEDVRMGKGLGVSVAVAVAANPRDDAVKTGVVGVGIVEIAGVFLSHADNVISIAIESENFSKCESKIILRRSIIC